MNQIRPTPPPADNQLGRSALLTVAEFHDQFAHRIGINMVYQLVRQGRIRSIRLGERKILIPSTELTDWPDREIGRTTS